MTAIVRTFTPQGFVLAADGRSFGTIDGAILNDAAQKIFPTRTLSGAFAFSIAGAIELVTDDRSQIAVNLADEARKSAESLENERIENLTDYAARFCHPIYRALNEAHKSGRLTNFPSHETRVLGERGQTITRLLLDGYLGEYPSSVNVRFFHEDGELREPGIETNRFPTGFHYVLGSPQIVRLLWDSNDPRFSEYRGPKIYAEDMTLQSAIERSRCYIQACSDPQSAAIDSVCRTIGGHIHIATITPSSGFQWVIAPLQVDRIS
jgi:hypothetical protein